MDIKKTVEITFDSEEVKKIIRQHLLEKENKKIHGIKFVSDFSEDVEITMIVCTGTEIEEEKLV